MWYGKTRNSVLPRFLKLSCWNVNGLGKRSVFENKLTHRDFLNNVNNVDLLILSEIWGHETLDIPGFEIISLSPPRKLTNKRSGRFSGGVLLAVASHLTKGVSIIRNSQDYIWSRLDKVFFNTEEDIFLCSCYIPPCDSPYFNPDTFSDLANDINFFQRNGNVILAGDLNARTGSLNDFIEADSSIHARSCRLPSFGF